MGLTRWIPAIVRRKCYAWSWRLRYWFLDTEDGRHARAAAFVMGLLLGAIAIARIAMRAALPMAAGEPVKAYGWIVWVIVLIVALLLAYATMPKTEDAKPQQTESPATEDGTPVKDYFGTVWVDHEDRFLLAWKIVGRDPIRAKGGK